MLEEEESVLQSKSALKASSNALAPAAPVGESLEPVKRGTKRPLTQKQREQRKMAAASRVSKQQKQKRRKVMLEMFDKMFDEDEEGLERRLKGASHAVVHQTPVEHEPQLNTPAAEALPTESGKTEKPGVSYEDQAFDQSETDKVLHNIPTRAGDSFQVRSLAQRQRVSPLIRNSVQEAVVSQGIVLLPLPTYHRSG